MRIDFGLMSYLLKQDGQPGGGKTIAPVLRPGCSFELIQEAAKRLRVHGLGLTESSSDCLEKLDAEALLQVQRSSRKLDRGPPCPLWPVPSRLIGERNERFPRVLRPIVQFIGDTGPTVHEIHLAYRRGEGVT